MVIKEIRIEQGYAPAVVIDMEDGSQRRIVDNGRDCCANHYISTDNDLTVFAGHTYQGHDLGESTYTEDDEVHEIQFLNVRTSVGVIVFAAHNEHNGYYGGFTISETVSPPATNRAKEAKP